MAGARIEGGQDSLSCFKTSRLVDRNCGEARAHAHAEGCQLEPERSSSMGGSTIALPRTIYCTPVPTTRHESSCTTNKDMVEEFNGGFERSVYL